MGVGDEYELESKKKEYKEIIYMTRKDKGWHNEPTRHGLASKGVKTSAKTEKVKGKHISSIDRTEWSRVESERGDFVYRKENEEGVWKVRIEFSPGVRFMMGKLVDGEITHESSLYLNFDDIEDLKNYFRNFDESMVAVIEDAKRSHEGLVKKAEELQEEVGKK